MRESISTAVGKLNNIAGFREKNFIEKLDQINRALEPKAYNSEVWRLINEFDDDFKNSRVLRSKLGALKTSLAKDGDEPGDEWIYPTPRPKKETYPNIMDDDSSVSSSSGFRFFQIIDLFLWAMLTYNLK